MARVRNGWRGNRQKLPSWWKKLHDRAFLTVKAIVTSPQQVEKRLKRFDRLDNGLNTVNLCNYPI